MLNEKRVVLQLHVALVALDKQEARHLKRARLQSALGLASRATMDGAPALLRACMMQMDAEGTQKAGSQR